VSDDLDPRQQWTPIHDAAPGYEVNWDGEFRALERIVGNRVYPAQPLATTVNNRGYEMIKYRNAAGERVTRTVHSVMLNTFVKGGIPKGKQSRHLDDDPRHNTWRPGSEEESRRAGGNLFIGDGRDQHRDKVRNGGTPPPPGPQHPCAGVPGHGPCDGKVMNEGRRCVPCTEQVGRDAARMLERGENLLAVARHFGYKGTRWTYQLAQKHGGYRGTEAEALTQKRGWLRRVTGTARERVRRGDGASRQAPAEAAGKGRPAALRAVSPQRYPGQSRTSTTPNVAERDHREPSRQAPKVTDSNHYPYPADLVAKRDERTRDGGTGRRRR